MPLGTEVGLSPDDIALDLAPSPRKGAEPLPNFRPMSVVAKRLMDQDGTWHGGGPWSRPHCASWAPSFPPQKRGRAPNFSVHFCCGQTAAWIKMPLGTEVGLGLRDIVLDGNTAPPPLTGHRPPVFSQCPLWPNSWMD